MRWSLDNLYMGFDSQKFADDFQALKLEIKNLQDWAEKNLTDFCEPVPKMEDYIRIQQKISTYETLPIYTNLILSVDSLNEKATKFSDLLDETYTELSRPSVLFQEFVGRIENLEKLIDSSTLLQEHRFLLLDLKENFKYLLSDKEELVLAKLKTTGSTAWETMHSQLTATLMVTVPGEEKPLPLSVVRNMAYDKDAETRKKAYFAELAAYEQIDKSSAFSLNSIKGEVLTVCKMRGYESPLDMTLINSYMDKETLDAMLTAIKDSLPMFRKYFKKKAEMLGHKNGLPFYDIFAPMGEADMKFAYDEAKAFVVKNFRGFSEELGDFAQYAFDSNWVDAEPREGKQGGAFCSEIHSIKECRILSNFTGSLSDVLTLAHELGHGYHGHCLIDESALNSNYPMPIAETASNFCEIILTKAALELAGQNEKTVILEQSISDAAQVVVDIYSRYLFETWVFENRTDGGLLVNELKELMQNAQKEAFGDSLDHEFLHPYMWICKPHYYSADYNFYNFPYAYGMLFARGLYAQYLNDKEKFVSKYNELLAATGKNSLREVGLIAGIDVRDPAFWQSSFKIIEKEIEEWSF